MILFITRPFAVLLAGLFILTGVMASWRHGAVRVALGLNCRPAGIQIQPKT